MTPKTSLLLAIAAAILVVAATTAGIIYASRSTTTPAAASSTTAAAQNTSGTATKTACIGYIDSSKQLYTDGVMHTTPMDGTLAQRTAWAASMTRILDRAESQILPGTRPEVATAFRTWISLERARGAKVLAGTTPTTADNDAAAAQSARVYTLCNPI